MTNEAAMGSDDRAPRSLFSVDDLPPGERYAAWKESASCIFDVDAVLEDQGPDFFASVEAQMFGQVMLARTSTVRQVWQRSPSRVAHDDMDHFMIQLYVEGDVAIDDGNESKLVPHNNLVVFDLSQESSSRTSRFTNLSLIISRELIGKYLLEPEDQHLRTISAEDPLTTLLRDQMISLHRLGEFMTASQATEVSSSIVALAAACMNSSSHEVPGGFQAINRATLHKAKRMIEQNLHDPSLNATRAAMLAGVSRTRLYELFEPHGGVANHIRERRLRRAMSMLVDREQSHLKIGAIALRCGFADESTFSRAFRKRYGTSPREARAEQGVQEVPDSPSLDGLDRSYEIWLSQL